MGSLVQIKIKEVKRKQDDSVDNSENGNDEEKVIN